MDVREFNYLFERDWKNAGGLIQPAIAAKILGLTRGRISQIWEERNFRKYIYDDPSKPLISLNDVKKLQDEKYINLSTDAKRIIDQEQAQWESDYEEILKKEAEKENKYGDMEPNKTYEEEITEEIDEYRKYMNKKISKK